MHAIWCRRLRSERDFLEILLNETPQTHVVFRRDRAIILALDGAFVSSSLGLPILTPEVVLLYKANTAIHEDNKADFR